MTLEEKVGQLFVSRVYGSTADSTAARPVAANRRQLGADNAAQLIARYHVGGIVYFDWAGNLRNPQQIAKLSNGIQTAPMNQDTAIPEFVNTDQEHGAVVHVGPPATQFRGSMAVGATRDAALARRAGAITGKELAAIGINQILAPVANVNVNPANPVIGVRSFGSQAPLVSELTAAQVHGMQDDGGIAATAKHFPGHGDTPRRRSTSYATAAPSMRAVADVISGALHPVGKLPLMVPHAGHPGSPLYRFGRGLGY